MLSSAPVCVLSMWIFRFIQQPGIGGIINGWRPLAAVGSEIQTQFIDKKGNFGAKTLDG